VCPRWLLLGERDLARKGVPQENWHAALRERIRRELYERGYNPSFIDEFLPEPSALAEQAVTDWLSRAVSAETKYFKEARETLHLNAIRQRRATEDELRVRLRVAEDALRVYEVRDSASEFPVPAIKARARNQSD
jgi:SOS response regulatory protein OraA/RecX